MVVGVFGEPATLDPYSPVASDLTYALAAPVYRSLYRFDQEGASVPDLVQSLDVSGEVATVTLVDARWSDGSPITSADVAATIARATPPSGLTEIDSVQRHGPQRLVLTGRVEDWPQTLARISFVLPEKGGGLYSGPFSIASRTEGLEVVLRPNLAAVDAPLLDEVTVRFTEGVEFLLALLRAGDLDVAVIPSSINLDQRMEELGLLHADVPGWERVVLDMEGSDLTPAQREEVAEAIDRRAIATGFLRRDGHIIDSLYADPGDAESTGPFAEVFRGEGRGNGTSVQIGTPSGDELVELIQRLVQVQLDRAGFDVELINLDARTFYGEWRRDDPVDIAIRRVAGGPAAGSEAAAVRSLDTIPLFQVESVIAWRAGVGGISVVPTFEGPLSRAHEWYLAPAGG